MKPFSTLKIWMPLLGLGAILALAPTSRAQEVSPDHFDENGMQDTAPAKPAAVKPKQPAAAATQARTNKPSTRAATQAASSKKPAAAAKPELVAVQDKRKVPASKSNKP